MAAIVPIINARKPIDVEDASAELTGEFEVLRRSRIESEVNDLMQLRQGKIVEREVVTAANPLPHVHADLLAGILSSSGPDV